MALSRAASRRGHGSKPYDSGKIHPGPNGPSLGFCLRSGLRPLRATAPRFGAGTRRLLATRFQVLRLRRNPVRPHRASPGLSPPLRPWPAARDGSALLIIKFSPLHFNLFYGMISLDRKAWNGKIAKTSHLQRESVIGCKPARRLSLGSPGSFGGEIRRRSSSVMGTASAPVPLRSGESRVVPRKSCLSSLSWGGKAFLLPKKSNFPNLCRTCLSRINCRFFPLWESPIEGVRTS